MISSVNIVTPAGDLKRKLNNLDIEPIHDDVSFDVILSMDFLL